MKVVFIWQDPRYGPAIAVVLRKRGEPPDVAQIPRSLPPGPLNQLSAIGRDITWHDHVERLAQRLPYGGGHWTEEEVPDGLDARQALYHLRRQDVLKLVLALSQILVVL